jgi:hypothetical protein
VKVFSSSSPVSRPTLVPTHARIQLVPGTTTLSIKQEADQLLLCNNEIKNDGAVPPLSHVFMVQCLTD